MIILILFRQVGCIPLPPILRKTPSRHRTLNPRLMLLAPPQPHGRKTRALVEVIQRVVVAHRRHRVEPLKPRMGSYIDGQIRFCTNVTCAVCGMGDMQA
jgi:hypothetical protein